MTTECRNLGLRCSRRLMWLASGLLLAIGCASPGSNRHGAAHTAARHPSVATSQPAALAGSPTNYAPPGASGLPATESSSGTLRQVQHAEEVPSPPPAPAIPRPQDRLPIDLATALRLGGANNLQIALAGQRVAEAEARLDAANAMWMPSLYGGVGYNGHDGRIQDTRGDVIDTNRNSLFVGGGPILGANGVTGASTQPRLGLGLPVGDVVFARLAERQRVRAADSGASSVFNDAQLQVAQAYLELVRAQVQVAIAEEAVRNAMELARLVDSRVKAGAAPPADGLRAHVDLANRQRERFLAEGQVRVVSAELVRLVRLDPTVVLFPLEDRPIPIDLVPLEKPLPELIAQGLASRPEVAESSALVDASYERLRQEQLRPLLPTFLVGMSAGGFGGGESSQLDHFGNRIDFDAQAVWELRNFGFGNRALTRERTSQNQQAQLGMEQVRDQVAADVARSYHEVQYRKQQIDAARAGIEAASEALPLSFKGILGGELRAIEVQQAVDLLAAARRQYLSAVIDYNRAQFQLLRALGRPPEAAPVGR